MSQQESRRYAGALSCQDRRCMTPKETVFFCGDCDSTLCEVCWNYQVAHEAGKKARDGKEHEKAALPLMQLYQDILHNSMSKLELEELHDRDIKALWFGVEKDKETGLLYLNDRGRYMSLLADSNVGEHVARYPQLVSFIGDTNAGKSTIIKILIRRQQLHNSKTTEGEFPSPISGSDAHEKTPTTGDVHLYADPGTARTQFPLLFADCEGLEGGTGEPSAIQFRRNAAARAESAARLVRRPRAIWMRHPRPIEWATSEDKRSRDFVVKELYPRLLYTFSDVTVFVLKNPKTFQSVLKKLIRWGVASLEKSLNVPRLPHAIVVLNMSNVEVDEWNPEIATEAFLNSIGARSGLGDDHEFKTLAANWKRGTDDEITNTYALLHKYYSSFTVVRVPSGAGRFTLLEQQAGVLQRVIEDKCAESFIVKNRYHMPVTSDGVTRYLQAGFDHFAKTLDIPFDFIKAELKNNPLPEDFADHIWALLLMILQLPALQPEQIMDTLGKYVASCIQLDAMQRDEGPVADLFRGYVPSLEAVLTEFRDKHWPCSFKDAKGQACKNSCSGHIAKGHQNEAGKPIGLGTHETNVDFYYYKQKWLAAIENRVMTIDKAVQIPDETSRHGLRAKFRSHILRDFMTKSFDNFRIMGARERFVSHTTCIACLQTIPEHVLPCGHVVCTDCVNIHGKSLSDCVTLIEQCPLHDTDRFVEPWRISTKPRHAGVRVLSLDGGGVRGIIELEVLKAIQDELGGSLSIQAFLDLIVGTSTGGIIALALGTKQWSLARCTDDFLSLCNDAFTKRDPESIPKWMTLFARQSIYKTKPLYGALRKSLGDDLMFGGTHEQQAQFPLKVAVTTHSDIGKGPAIITNYSRPDNSNDEYDLIRSSHPEQEMKVWEAAAATSAAPKYFKTFIHEATDRSFVDGALYWNNPAVLAESERQLLWPDKAAVEPDILLSIGTGQHTAHINEQIAAQDSGNTPFAPTLIVNRGMKAKKRFRRSIKVLAKRFDNMLDTERSWRKFENQIERTRNVWPNRRPLPYVRWNVDLRTKPPKLDAVLHLRALQRKAKIELGTKKSREMTQLVANQLVASTFYFHKEKTSSQSKKCFGSIRCRFENHTEWMGSLGEYLLRQAKLSFVVREAQAYQNHQEIQFAKAAVQRMALDKVFEPIQIEIPVWNQMARTDIALRLGGFHVERLLYPISGFPQQLLLEETATSRRSSSFISAPRLLARWNHKNLETLESAVPLRSFLTTTTKLALLASMRLEADSGFPILARTDSFQSKRGLSVLEHLEDDADAVGGAEQSDSTDSEDS